MNMQDYFQLIGFGPTGWGPELAAGTVMTFAVAITGFAIGGVIGAAIAWAKIAGPAPVRYLGEGYTTILRGIPDLLVIYLFYFGGSAALGSVASVFGHDGFISVPAFASGAMAIGVVSAAYQAEVFRGAYRALSRGEIEAASAAGMHDFLMLRRIIAPQILRHAIPGLGNVWLLVLKESALISVTGVVELLRTAHIAAGSTRKPFEFYLTAAAIYLVITYASTLIFKRTETRARRGFRGAV